VKNRVAGTVAEVRELRDLWSEILEASPRTIFQDFDWNLLALETFRDESPHFVVAESDSSVAILPVVKRNDSLAFAGGPLFDYREAVCAGDDSAVISALDALSEVNLPLNVNGIRRGPGIELKHLAPQPWTAAPYVSSRDLSAQEFADRHARGRRALRRLNETGATVSRVSAMPDLIEAIYREKGKEPSSWGENVFRDERCVTFMGEVASLPNKPCEVFQLERDGKRIAALVTLIDDETRRFYTTWMDPEWSRHSPGIALLFEATRLTLEQGFDCDYMTGEQPYKLRFATGSEPLYKVEASAQQLAAVRLHVEKPAVIKAA